MKKIKKLSSIIEAFTIDASGEFTADDEAYLVTLRKYLIFDRRGNIVAGTTGEDSYEYNSSGQLIKYDEGDYDDRASRNMGYMKDGTPVKRNTHVLHAWHSYHTKFEFNMISKVSGLFSSSEHLSVEINTGRSGMTTTIAELQKGTNFKGKPIRLFQKSRPTYSSPKKGEEYKFDFSKVEGDFDENYGKDTGRAIVINTWADIIEMEVNGVAGRGDVVSMAVTPEEFKRWFKEI